MSRHLLVRVVQAAIQLGHTRFARQACLNWLAAYPGDLPVNLLYANVLLQDGRNEQAIPILARLCQVDPEYLDAVQAYLRAQKGLHNPGEAQSKNARRRRQRLQNSTNDILNWAMALGINPRAEKATTLPTSSQEASTPIWSEQVLQARRALEASIASDDKNHELDEAEIALTPALANSSASPLVGVTQLRVLKAKNNPTQSIRGLAEYYLQQWPECVQFQLFLAETLMETGQEEEAVALLHRAAARDLTGQVAIRLWGRGHPYRSLWPERLEHALDIPIPAQVAAALGWNQLPVGEPITTPLKRDEALPVNHPVPKGIEKLPLTNENHDPSETGATEPAGSPKPVFPTIPETLRSVQVELEKVAQRLQQPELARADGRFPVYVIMTTQNGLHAQYGEKASVLTAEMQRLAQAVGARRDWRSVLFFADEGLPPDVRSARPSDPWAIKLALADLDAHLGCKGEMIGAVLIVGGPEVVPFHHLPNPVDDADDYVPSDNPYATRDENYFIPEWPVGRLPGGVAKDPSGLQILLKSLTDQHIALAKHSKPRNSPWWIAWLNWLLRRQAEPFNSKHKRPSFGYTAEVWRKASQIVFRPIGEAKALRVSPPLSASGQSMVPLPSGKLAYFNLHGLVDAVEWYGQSEAVTSSGNGSGVPNEDQRDYPIAIRPQDIVNSGHAPQVVFSEACYGAHILGKSIEEALALKFLQAGSQAMVGSTCTAYGSINTPLTAADFLGHAFWSALKQGSPAGEALQRAKVSLAREMHRRQGYLDGEDQKTLISFVLYGDPLAQPLGQVRQAKGKFRPAVLRPLKPPRGVKTICDRVRLEDQENPLPAEVVDYVKSIVEQYLPGMKGAQVSFSQEHIDCNMDGHQCPTGQLHMKHHGKSATSSSSPASAQTSRGMNSNAIPPTQQRRIVILSKVVGNAAHVHRHYARLTLDEQNRLVKLVVSR